MSGAPEAHGPRPPSRWGGATPLGRALRLAAVSTALLAAMTIGVPLCPFALITRHPCPGCGLTRATFALARGHLDEALHLHPMSLVLVPAVVLMLGYNAIVYVREGRVAAAESTQARWATALGVALAIATLAVWIARFLGAFGGPVPVWGA